MTTETATDLVARILAGFFGAPAVTEADDYAAACAVLFDGNRDGTVDTAA
ncbi:MAG: hypothetical protein QM662_18190 [Gordonia sp. (in: high G+C Gram-positive bacteria)]